MTQEVQTADTLRIDSTSHLRNLARAQREEEELEQLIAEFTNGATDTSEVQQEATEEASQDFSDSEEASEEPTKTAEPLSKEEASFKKRYGDLRRHMQEKEQEWKIEFEKLKLQLDKSANNELVLPKTEQDIEAWAKKYPDVAGIVEAIADRKASERASDIDKRLREIEELRVQARQQKAEAELMHMHPDFEQIRSDDKFHDWAEEQPKWVQDALYDNVDDAKAVARVIDLYKADKGIAKAKSSHNDKSAASSIKSRSRSTPNADGSGEYFSESQVNKMSDKEYEKNVDAIMEAMQTGKFIYDVSK